MVDLISAGDTAWILGATILVLLMSVPGIAFFYGGLTKKKNVLNSMFLALIAFAIASVIWVVYGYSFAFGDTSLHGLMNNSYNSLCCVSADFCRADSCFDIWVHCRKNESILLDDFHHSMDHSCLHSHCPLGMGRWMAHADGRT